LAELPGSETWLGEPTRGETVPGLRPLPGVAVAPAAAAVERLEWLGSCAPRAAGGRLPCAGGALLLGVGPPCCSLPRGWRGMLWLRGEVLSSSPPEKSLPGSSPLGCLL
jgi:hypothetical protein